MNHKLRLGLIAPKNTPAEQQWLLSFLRDVQGEPYRRGRRYDLVWFLNVSPELRWIKANTDTRTFVTALEPKFMYPLNYDPDLLALTDRYLDYRNFASAAFCGQYEQLIFPAYSKKDAREVVAASADSVRDMDFCIFARHDPNIRRALADAAEAYRSIRAGPLFGNTVDSKQDIQRHCRYELITENDINPYYCSEKLGHALAAGCVPVYWGASDIKARLPADLYIDMRDFPGAEGVPDVKRVLEYCMTPGIYEKHARVLREKALSVLVDQLSCEACICDPVQRYIDELGATGWRSRHASAVWHAWRLRGVLATLRRSLFQGGRRA